MITVKRADVEALMMAGIRVLKARIHDDNGFIVIADVIRCSNAHGNQWVEERPLALYDTYSVRRYIDNISQ